MIKDNIKVSFPNSKKVYLQGKMFPQIKVAMREVSLTPTVDIVDGEKKITDNGTVLIYDTSGPFSDHNATIDLHKGLPRLREEWILERGDVDQLDTVTSEYGKSRLEDSTLDHLRFDHL